MIKDNPSIDDIMKLMGKYGVEYSPYTFLSDLEKFIVQSKAKEKALQNAIDYGSSTWEDWLYNQCADALDGV